MIYEKLLMEAEQDVYVYEEKLHHKVKGLQADNVVWINDKLTETEKYCVLAEELGHYHTSSGNIIDQSKLTNRKQEKRARSWAYDKAVPLKKIVQAHQEHITNKFELATFLGITEPFLEEALLRYQEKYGKCVTVGDYTVCFEPLGVIGWFNIKNF